MALSSLAPAVAGLLMAAESGTSTALDISSIIQSSVNTAQTQVFSVLGIVAPVIAGITVAVVGVKFGIGWIRKIRG